MKLKKISVKLGLSAAVALASMAIVPAVHAQFGGMKVPSLGGSKSSEASVDVGALMSQQKGLMGRFNSAMNNMLLAQARTLEAAGLKEASQKAAAAAEHYASGNVVGADQMKRHVELSKEGMAIIEAEKKKGEKLSADGKKILVTAVPHYVKGLSDGISLPKEFEKWASAAQSGLSGLSSNPMEAMKLKDGLGVAMTVITNLPELVKAWGTTTSAFVGYAKGNEVDVSQVDSIGELTQ